MRIIANAIGTPYTGASAPTRRTFCAGAETVAVAGPAIADRNRAGAVLAGYELTHVSRRELFGLADKLYDAGVLTGERRLDLTAPCVDVLNADMQSVLDPDQKRNFLGDVQAALDDVMRSRPHDVSSIAHFSRVKHLADSLASMTATARAERD